MCLLHVDFQLQKIVIRKIFSKKELFREKTSIKNYLI